MQVRLKKYLEKVQFDLSEWIGLSLLVRIDVFTQFFNFLYMYIKSDVDISHGEISRWQRQRQ